MADQILFEGTQQTSILDTDRLTTGLPSVAGSKWISWASFKTFLATLFMSLTGNQTVAGVKTFGSSPLVPDPTLPLQVANLQTVQYYLSALPNKTQYQNKTTNFTHPLSASQRLESVDFRLISGAVTIRIGLTDGGTEIISDRVLVSGADKNIPLGKSYPTAKTLYINFSGGGTVTANIWYLNPIF